MAAPGELDFYTDPTLYDQLVAPPDEALAFYAAEAAARGGPVLELACGTGRLTIPLARALSSGGARVVGVDLAPAMVAAARDKAATAGVAVEWLVADMRRLALRRRFATIYVAFNSLLHLSA